MGSCLPSEIDCHSFPRRALSLLTPSRRAIRFGAHEDLDPTPRAPAEPFRFTPSLTPSLTPSVFLDPNSAAFTAFADEPPGLFTPTPTSPGFAVQSSVPANAVAIGTTHDLQAPGIGISIGTPLTLPNTNGLPAATTATAAAAAAAPQTIQPDQFHNYQPFSQQPLQPHYLDPSHYEVRAPSDPGSPMDLSGAGGLLPDPMPLAAADSMKGVVSLNPPMPLDQKQFDHISRMLPTSSERSVFLGNSL